MADRQAELSFRKACAGMKGAQATIGGIGQRIRNRTITEEDEGVIRWTISGLQSWQLAALLGWGPSMQTIWNGPMPRRRGSAGYGRDA